MLLNFEIPIEGVFMMVQVGTELLNAQWRAEGGRPESMGHVQTDIKGIHRNLGEPAFSRLKD